MGRLGSYTGHVDASPDDVFAAVTDTSGLPEWNERIQRVVMEQSRSRVLEIDPVARRFRYRSNPEGDPDFSIWTWEIAPEAGGSQVRVSWDLNPQQLANRVFWGRVRARGLKKELPASLAALETFITAREHAR